MAAKLKVYATRIGFHDAVVAAPSQKTALAAWDIRENLFSRGAALVSDDPQAIAAATARPGTVLRRAAGSSEPYSETPAPPAVPNLKSPAKAKIKAPAAAPKPRRDRRALDAAGRALAELAAEEKRAREDFARRRRELETEERAEERALSARRTALQRELDRARRAYEREG